MLVPCRVQLEDKKRKMDKKKPKVRKGWLAVRVGLEEEGGYQRFMIPISYLCHPLYRGLLEKAQEVYGCRTTGLLRLPCSVEEFHQVRCKVEQEYIVPQYHHHPQLRYCA